MLEVFPYLWLILKACLPGNIITPGPQSGASTHRQAAKSTLAGVSHVCPEGEHVFMAGGLSGSEMAH